MVPQSEVSLKMSEAQDVPHGEKLETPLVELPPLKFNGHDVVAGFEFRGAAKDDILPQLKASAKQQKWALTTKSSSSERICLHCQAAGRYATTYVLVPCMQLPFSEKLQSLDVDARGTYFQF